MVKAEYIRYEESGKRSEFGRQYMENKYGEGAGEYQPSKVIFKLTYKDGHTEEYDARADACRLLKKTNLSRKMKDLFIENVKDGNFYFSEENHRFENKYSQISLFDLIWLKEKIAGIFSCDFFLL